MVGELVLSQDRKGFEVLINTLTDKKEEIDRRSRVVEKYSPKYDIHGEIVNIRGHNIGIDCLPTIDAMLIALDKYTSPKEVIGAALFKVEKEHTLFLTDLRDINLKKVYDAYKKEADELADVLWQINNEEFYFQWDHTTAKVLIGSFATVFGQTYGDWRRSLGNPNT